MRHDTDLMLPQGVVVPFNTWRGFMWMGRERVEPWFAAAPALVAEVCDRWRITLDPDLPRLSMNLVMFGESEIAGPVVLKCAPPHEDITAEIRMMEQVSGQGYARVLAADHAAAWMLQARVMPGTTLQHIWDGGQISDEAATDIAISLQRRQRPPFAATSDFHSMRRWTRDLFRYAESPLATSGTIPVDALRLATQLLTDFLEHPREGILLHGDLQHNNILQDHEHGWTVIDPKGVIGDPAFEIGAWLYNPIGIDAHPDLPALTDRRLDQLSEGLGINRLHLWRWGLIAAVLSDCWTLLDDPEQTPFSLSTTSALMSLPECEQAIRQAN